MIAQVLLAIAVAIASLGAPGSLGNAQSPALNFDCATAFPPSLNAKDLVARYGVQNVRTDSIYVGEGMSELGTVLFPAEPRKRVEILWKDPGAQRSPDLVFIRRGPSDWRTPSGIGLGTSLHDLETLNAGPFRMAGFAFDGSGSVFSWAAGRLEEPAGASCRFRTALGTVDLDKDSAKVFYDQVIGDHTFSSGHPALQFLNPQVSYMGLDYRRLSPQ